MDVFRDVKRVLRDDGTLWLNLSSSYAGSGKGIGSDHGKAVFNDNNISKTNWKNSDYKPKDLIPIPWIVALELQRDGWYLRKDIIWEKGNAMCENVGDRCTSSHEYLLHFSKSRYYYFDNEAIKEPSVSNHPSGNGFKRSARVSYQNKDGSSRGNDNQWIPTEKRNKRSVWHVNTRPYKAAHFATFPPELIEPCILAGCTENGTVLDPFGGSGTVGQVCNILNRNAILIELNPEYKPLIIERINSKPKSKKRKVSLIEKVTLQQNLIQYCN